MVFLSTRICILPASNLSGKLLHSRKAKRYSFHPYRLMFIFFQRRQHSCRRAFSLLESVRRIAPPMRIDSHHAILSEKLLHSRKAKRYSFHPYRLMFIFSNADGTATTWRFLYSNLCMELFRHRQTYLKSCYISRKTKAVEIPPIPLDVYFFPTQTAQLPHGVFSTRICASNRSASVKPIRKAATSTKIKAVQFPPIPLDVYFLPTQTARLPHGVFSTRICASNRSASADT